MTSSSHSFRLSSCAWIAIPLFALGFLIWVNVVRLRQINYVAMSGESTAALIPGSGSPPIPWQTQLIVPGHLNRSYEWLDQTRQMFARQEWRVRHVDYENAPYGREVYAASPYRWCLGLIAFCDHTVSGRSFDQSVERAALFADPLLHLLLLVVTVIFVVWQFGVLPAALLSAGFAALFPLSGEFIPGVPDDRGLAQACAIWSVLPLLVGARLWYSPAAGARARSRRWFLLAGIAGGLGLWVDVGHQVPVLIGIAVGALLAAFVGRGAAPANQEMSSETTPWRLWALGGGGATLAAYFIEYFPAHLGSWELRAIHPVYGVAWLGLGEILAHAVGWIHARKPEKGLRAIVMVALAVAALAALPVAMAAVHNHGFLEADPSLSRLTKLSGGALATSLWAWLIHDGVTTAAQVTLLPLLMVGPAAWLLTRPGTGFGHRSSLALALGPVVIAAGFACTQLSWWNGVDALLLVLLTGAAAAVSGTVKSQPGRWAFVIYTGIVLLPGAIHLIPPLHRGSENALNESEVYGLIERDLARWLAKHVGKGAALILAPHDQTTTLYYHGGLPGLATLDWENRDGLAAAVRIVSASTPEEAKELVNRRGVTHIVIPSWDSYLDIYTKMGMGRVEGTFMELLHQWKLPSWLRPAPYQFPVIPGFEGQSVIILEVVPDEPDEPAELSRIAEYFIEMGQPDLAVSAALGLRRYPADLGALVARAQVEIFREDTVAFAKSVEQLRARLASKADRSMPWDRRANLAVVLMRGKQADLAREQVRRCLADIDEEKLRSLNTGSLYRLQVLGKAFGLPIKDEKLRALALDLLPADMRSRLQE